MTTSPNPAEIDFALDRLETMAAEYKGRNICVGYNFENEPDTSSLHNLDRKFWYAFETGLAMRLLSDYGKEIPQALIMNHQSAFSFLSQAASDPQMLPYPTRMPLGSGNKYYRRPWRYYPSTVYIEPCTPSMYVGDINTYVESFAAYLNDLEDVTSFTIESDSGIDIVSSSLDSPEITYEVEAISAGTYDITIVATSETPADYGDLTFLADFETDENANYGLGALGGTLNGTATVADGSLNLTGGTVAYISYDGTYNVPSGNTGCIRIRYTPNYTGYPPAGSYSLFESSSGDTNINKLWLFHSFGTFGYLTFQAYNSFGLNLISLIYSFSAVAGTEYEIEVDFDFVSGSTNMFLNGSLVATSSTTMTAETRDTLHIGYSSSNPTHVQNQSINEISIYDAAQHTSDYEVTDLEEYTVTTRTTTRTNTIVVSER